MTTYPALKEGGVASDDVVRSDENVKRCFFGVEATLRLLAFGRKSKTGERRKHRRRNKPEKKEQGIDIPLSQVNMLSSEFMNIETKDHVAKAQTHTREFLMTSTIALCQTASHSPGSCSKPVGF